MLTILTTENLYFGHGHGQNGYFFGLISCQNLRLTISTMKNLDFGHGHGRNFDHTSIAAKTTPFCDIHFLLFFCAFSYNF